MNLLTLMKVSLLCLAFFMLASCGGEPDSVGDNSKLIAASKCVEEDARNRCLAFSKVQARLVAEGGESGERIAVKMNVDSESVYSLIANKKYLEACEKMDEVAKKYGIDLNGEMETTVLSSQLSMGGGGGQCSVAEAAQKQMSVHSNIQKKIAAGEFDQNIMRKFSEETKEYGLLLSTDPGAACDLLDKVAQKIGV